MKQIIAAIELGTLLQTVSYIEDGEVKTQLELPMDNVPETVAYYAQDKNTPNIIIYGNKEYSEKIKDLVINKAQTEYGLGNLTIELREI